jgi:small-conductance mechanosensitive channel
MELLQQQLQDQQAEHHKRLEEMKEEAETSARKQQAILEQQQEELANQKTELEAAYAYQQELAAAHASATEAKTAALQEVCKRHAYNGSYRLILRVTIRVTASRAILGACMTTQYGVSVMCVNYVVFFHSLFHIIRWLW